MRKLIDVYKIYKELKIEIGPEGHKHVGPGWVQIECPFCTGNEGYHLGYNLREGYFNCWRCGYKSTLKVLRKLYGCSYYEAKKKQSEFTSKKIRKTASKKKEKKTRNSVSHIKLPAGTCDLQPAHRRYIRSRGFNSKTIERIWQVRGTHILGPFGGRLIIPIYFDDDLVSFQGRDITGRSMIKYKNCPKDDEKIHMKDLVYGYDKVPGRSVVICEGVMDVWRLGPGAVATFGTGFTREQIDLLGESFDKRFILYDTDSAGKEAAKKLAKLLAVYDGKTEILTLKKKVGDPGELSKDEAASIMRELVI